MKLMQKGCIIVPYRDREEHLRHFVAHYTEHLPMLDIFVIEQSDNKPFNRAKLLNIGFLEAGHKYDYAAYHDVDMLVEDGDYTFPDQPTHLAGQCSQFDYKMPYDTYFGGVLLMNSADMRTVNGYNNDFWGWGAEDDEMCRRVVAKGFTPEFRPNRYTSLEHQHNYAPVFHKKNVELLKQPIDWNNGLTSCKYELKSSIEYVGYTLISVTL